jgi:serine/threonine-protein kinase
MTTRLDTVAEPAGPGGDLPPGTPVGRYRVERRIGQGGFATVYAAIDPATGERVAIKVLRPEVLSRQTIERFVREGQAAHVIRHPSVVRVLEVGVLDDTRPYMVMELLDGMTLHALVRSTGRLSPAEAQGILTPVAGALVAAHRQGIIHRDLKPGNIIVIDSGGARTVKLLDFGIAKLLSADAGESLTATGHRLGTPHIMAPEQIRARAVDARTDIYALGVILYFLLTGDYPFDSDSSIEIEHMHLESPPPVPSWMVPVSPAIDAMVLRSMAKDPAARFPDAAAFLEALEGAVAGEGAAAPTRTRTAAALYVEVRIAPEADDRDSEALLDALEYVLDIAERTMRTAGLQIALMTGTSALGVVPFDREEEAEGLIAAARSLAEEVAALDLEGLGHVNICLHVAHAVVRATDRREIAGGPLLDIATWAPRDNLAGLSATRSAASRLFRLDKLAHGPYVAVAG